MSESKETAVPHCELRALCEACFRACGMYQSDSHLLADTLVKADLGGTHSHGVLRVRGSNHCGAMAYHAIQALEHDMIGIATTNALPTMAPWGGAERILGINPLAVAIPAKERVDGAIDQIHNCRLADGYERTYAPGEKEFLSREAYERDGIPLTSETLRDIAAVAKEVGVATSFYSWLS